MLNKLLGYLKNPPAYVYVISYVSTIISAALAILIAIRGFDGSWLDILAYTLFAVAAISLSYSVFLSIKTIAVIKKRAIAALNKNRFTYLLAKSYGFRTIIFTIFTFLTSMGFAAVNLYMGIIYSSVWYGALALYYLIICLIRGGILLYHSKRFGKSKELFKMKKEYLSARNYRNSGILMLLLNIALSSAIAQMIFDERRFVYLGWTLYAYAAYTFYKTTMSIINIVKVRRYDDMTLSAVRSINLIDASISILALQTSLLYTFTTEKINISYFNTATGSVVSLFAIGMGVYMTVRGQRALREIRKNNTEKQHGKQ